MATTRHKLKIGGEQTAGQAVSYLADPQATGDYYSESRRAPMAWAASDHAKAELGLGDRVELWKVERLLNGQHPLGGQLLRRYGPDQTMTGAIDLTVSPAPKSVSILWALAGPQLRKEIALMVVGAVAGAVGVMTHHKPLVRERFGPGPNDVRAIKANDIVGLEVLHTTARLSESKPGIPDPQLHVHSLLFADLRENGQLRAIEERLILMHKTELDGEAQGALASKLEQAGFEIERTLIRRPNGQVKRTGWEVKGIPESLIKSMSARSQEITELMRQYREQTGREAIGPGWERYVTGRRGPKSKASAEELHTIWAQEAEQHGLGSAEVERLAAKARQRAQNWKDRDENSPEAEQLRQEILTDLCRDHAFVPERHLHALGQQRAIGLVSPYIAGMVMARMFGSGDLFRFSEGFREGQVTTLEVLAAEQRARKALERLQRTEPEPAVDQAKLEAEYKRSEDQNRPFDAGQREAIAVALTGARFISIAGPAGTGKGLASEAMVNLWRDQGRRVFALAVAGRTAQQAAHDSGAEPLTLDQVQARLERESLKLRSSDVLLVDEAAMIDHQRYADLLETAATTRTTVVQVGDDHQLNPIGPGGLWTLFHEVAEQQGAAAALREVHRARNPAEAQAWTDIREGRFTEGLSFYRDVGQLHLYDQRAEMLRGMARRWWTADRESVMVVDSSNAERDELNRLAQAKRLEAGELGQEPISLSNGRELHVGDRVLVAEHSIDLDPALNEPGPRIENGTRATVQALGPAVSLELHEPQGSRMVQVDTSADLELGYARHAVKSQGMTVPTTDLGIGSRTGGQELYEMVSRSQEGSHVHALRSELEAKEVDVPELEESRLEVRAEERPQSQAAEFLPDSQLERLRMFNEAELQPGHVVTFGEALPLREPSGIELGEHGVVRSIHQGGITFDFAHVELVGGRNVRVYQPDQVEPASVEITPEAVLNEPPRPDQRDPYSLHHLPLQNGSILARGDLVRFAETQGQVVEVARHGENCAYLQVENGGERISVNALSNVEILKTGQQVAAELAAERARAVENATIRDIDKQVSRSEPKRAVADAQLDPGREAEGTTVTSEKLHDEARLHQDATRTADVNHDRARLNEPEHIDSEPAAERLRESAELAAEPTREPSPSASHEQAREQAHEHAIEQSAGRTGPEHSPEHAPQPQMEASR